MPLTREQKQELVEKLKDKFSRKTGAFFVSFAGVDVKTSQQLRHELKKGGGEYTVAKKTLLTLALQALGRAAPEEFMVGQVGLSFDYGSPVNTAKTLLEFTRKSSLAILGGIIGDEFLSGEQVKELALLPSIEILRSRLAAIIKSPIVRLVNITNSVTLNLINTLKTIASSKTN